MLFAGMIYFCWYERQVLLLDWILDAVLQM